MRCNSQEAESGEGEAEGEGDEKEPSWLQGSRVAERVKDLWYSQVEAEMAKEEGVPRVTFHVQPPNGRSHAGNERAPPLNLAFDHAAQRVRGFC